METVKRLNTSEVTLPSMETAELRGGHSKLDPLSATQVLASYWLKLKCSQVHSVRGMSCELTNCESGANWFNCNLISKYFTSVALRFMPLMLSANKKPPAGPNLTSEAAGTLWCWVSACRLTFFLSMMSTSALKKSKQKRTMMNTVKVPPVAVLYSVSPLYLRNWVAGKKSHLTRKFLNDLMAHMSNILLQTSLVIGCAMHHSKVHKVIERTILKSVLPVLALNNDWSKWTVMLGRISAISFEERMTKEKKPRCIVCERQYDNYLLLLLHLELVHRDSIEVTSYQFHDETMAISTKTRHQSTKIPSHFSKDSTGECLLGSLKERSRQILTSLFSKCSKKTKSEKREYFHAVDIFRPLHPDSSDEDSDGDIGKVQQQLQRMRISDFTDVNQNDKMFFIKWNEAVHQCKKVNVYLNDENIRDLLLRFAKVAKKEQLKRASLVMHAWTLWSAGRIASQDVHFFLNAYDKATP